MPDIRFPAPAGPLPGYLAVPQNGLYDIAIATDAPLPLTSDGARAALVTAVGTAAAADEPPLTIMPTATAMAVVAARARRTRRLPSRTLLRGISIVIVDSISLFSRGLTRS